MTAEAMLTTLSREHQCAACGEEGRDGRLVVRWNGLASVLSCLRHGDAPRTRPIDSVYEAAKRQGLEVRYGETLTYAEAALRRRWPRPPPQGQTPEERERMIDERERLIDDLFG